MMSVRPSKVLRVSAPPRAWDVVAGVLLLHMALAALLKFGLPLQLPPKKSEITIELAGAMVRGDGGDGRAGAQAAPKPAPKTPPKPTPQPTASKPVKNPELARPPEQKSAPPTTATATPAATAAPAIGGAAAGVESAPTVDADYKAGYLNNPKPPYPPVAFQMRIEGTVTLKALVLPDGSCGQVTLARSSGNALLDQSALSTVAQWKFTPAKSQGKTVSQWVSIPITFSVKRR